MGLTQIQGVKVGSIIRVKGTDYKVARNNITNLVLNKKVGIAFEESFTSTKVLLGDNTNHNTYVDVVGQPVALTPNLTEKLKAQLQTPNPAASNLTEQLRKQKAQQDLTASLRSQVEEEVDEDDDDYLEDEEDEDDEDDDVCQSYHYRPAVGFAAASSITDELATKKDVLTVNLRSQAAHVKAEQASEQSLQAWLDGKVAVSQLGKRLDVHGKAHNALADKVERYEFNQEITNVSLSNGVRDTREYAQAVSDVAHNALRKVEAIETKQKREELKMNIQDQLNASLAKKSLTSDLQAQLNQKSNKTIGGNGTMKNLFGAFKNQFGKVEGQFAYSVVTNGLALRKGISNEYVAYDKAAKTLTDVSGLTLKFDVPAFKLPVKELDVVVGDLIIHNGEYVYVTGVADGYLETINPAKAIRGSVIPTKNAIFGAAFYTVVKTLDAAGQGGFNPLLLMALGKGNKDELLPLLLMSGGLGNGTKGAIDPTMLMLLGDEMDDLLPLVLMQQGGVAGQGFNPLMFLAMNKGGKLGDMLPFLMMQQGGQAGAMNPMMLMALSDGGSDMKELLMMQALTGQNLFGGAAPVVAPAAAQVKDTDKSAK